MTFGEYRGQLPFNRRVPPSAAARRAGHAVGVAMAAIWQHAFTGPHWAGRTVSQFLTALARDISGRRRNGLERGRLAAAMVEYAKLCLALGTPRDLQQAAGFLDEAADIYRELGRVEEAEKAISMKPPIEHNE